MWNRSTTVAAISSLVLLRGAFAAPPASQPARPFTGAYMHLEQMLPKNAPPPARQAALAAELDRFKSSGMRIAMPYVRDTRGGVIYESKVVPLRRQKDWDALAVFMEEARKRDIEVWPVICVVPSGHDTPAGILSEHPDWALRDKAGKPTGYISPCNPEARKWMVATVAEVAKRYKPDGVLLDYLRFPSQNVQLDAASAAEYQRQFPNDTAASEAERKQHLQQFKVAGLTALAREISDEARRARPGIKIGLYTWGPHVVSGHNVSQDWQTWVGKGYIDMVNVSGYCYRDNYGPEYMKTFETRMKDAVRVWHEAGGKAELTFTLGVKTSHGQVHSAAEIGEYRRVAREAGIEGFGVFTWSYLQPYLMESRQAGYLGVR